MGERAKNFMNLVNSSEMVCSLRYEGISGCPYNSFTPRSIAVLSVMSSAMALVSLIVGM